MMSGPLLARIPSLNRIPASMIGLSFPLKQVKMRVVRALS